MISAVLIVKNEEEHLAACLESLRGVMDEIVVVDTGSSDGTVDITRRYTDRVLEFAWRDDFAAARNFALEQARGEWVLTIDADERVLDPAAARAALVAFCQNDPHIVGLVEILNITGSGDTAQEVVDETERFFRRDFFRYHGAIHEQLVSRNGEMATAPTGVRLLHLGYALDAGQAEAKAARNIRLLNREAAAHPEDEYVHYQLGKSYFSIQRYNEAASALETALAAIDWRRPARPRSAHGPLARKVLTDLVTTLAYCYANTERLADARALLQEHAEWGHPGTARADFPHAQGYVELMLGNLQAARAAYEASLEFGPGQEDVRGTGSFASAYHLGLIAEAENNLVAAWNAYGQSLAFKPDYLVTLRRMVDLAAERQVAPPAALLATAERAAFQDVYVDRLRRYLENAMLAEAGFLAKTAAKLDPILLERCRRVLQEFAGRPES